MDEPTTFAFDRVWRARTDRRAFLLGGLALVGAGALTRVQARPRWSASPFSLGIASGDPAHDGVVPLDAPRARSAGRRRHAAGAGRGQVGGRGR